MATIESPASVNGDYDPTTDKARKANSNDPGWKYGYWANLEKRNEVTCILCGIPQNGGIRRLKQHLAGGYGDAKMCESSKLTTAIRKEMGDYLEKNKRKRTLFLDEEEEATQVVEVIDVENEASVIHHPSSGTAAKQRRSAYQFTAAKPKAAPKANKSVIEMLRPTPEEVVEERYSKSCQPTTEASLKTKEEKDYVDMQWALWFYECGIPFNAAAARQFQIAIEATAQYGSGYIPPTPYKLGEPLLKEAVTLTSATRKDHEKAWKHYGCTLMSDGDEKSAMPEVAALMNHAKERIKLSFDVQRKQPLLKKILEIIERRWENQMDHPLYGAALFLNPGKFRPLVANNDDTTIGHLKGCFLDVLGRMVQDEETRNKIDAQAMDYEKLRGPAFSNKLAIQNIEKMNPIEWWCSYGGRAIELQRFARRIVSLCASSSGCERNWSTFEFIHTKKRNRLLHKRLNDIVFVSYNRKMKSRFLRLRQEKKGKTFDPLVLENFDWDNEWADSLYVPAQGGRGCDCDLDLNLAWQPLDEDIGASSQALQGRNVRRCARNSAPTQAVEEEEEEEDPHDDAYVSDCEDAPANSSDGQNNGATNIIDEFDDGY